MPSNMHLKTEKCLILGRTKCFHCLHLKKKKIYSFAATNRKVSFWVDLKRKCFPLSNFF